MKTYIVHTEWTGYSRIEVEADSPQDAEARVKMGDYDPNNEMMTGGDLSYGYDNEKIIEVEEIS